MTTTILDVRRFKESGTRFASSAPAYADVLRTEGSAKTRPGASRSPLAFR